MATEKFFKVLSTYRDRGYKYSSPPFYVWAINEDEAAKSSALYRFKEWRVSAHIIKK